MKVQSIQGPPDWARGAVIYQVNTRQFTPDGTFNAFAKHLPRIKALGVKILWFMPAHPIGKMRRKGGLGSYYAISDYDEINPEFGARDDFKRLVKQIHDLDMKVLMDLVVNHTAWDHPWVSQHPEWYVTDENGVIIKGDPDWDDTAKLDYDNKELCDAVSTMMQHWVREYDIDGYRCDVAHFVPAHFWRRAIPELHRIKPVFMLAESDDPWLHDAGFHMTYSTWLYRRWNAIAAGKRAVSGIVDLLRKERREFPPDAIRMRFTSNHDENSWLDPAPIRLGKEGSKAFAVLTFTLPGMPLIYNGQEIGLDKRLLFFDKDEIEWNYDSEYNSFYQGLVKLYTETPALYAGSLVFKSWGPIFAFVREYREQQVLVAINLTKSRQTARISTRGLKKEMHDMLSGNTLTTNGRYFNIDLEAWQYGIYS